MSAVKNINELFLKIDLCVDEMKDQIKKLTRDYEQYIVRKSKKSHNASGSNKGTNSSSVKKSTISEIRRQTDTICLAKNKSGKRCTKKRAEEGPDTELCKLHNNSKYAGIDKYEYGELDVEATPPGPTDPAAEKQDSPETESPNTSDDEFIEVKLTVDADGDTIDQDGNIWCLEKQIIIGKKDPRSKCKLFFKTV